jgi:CRISPR-associated endonuclease/helicase Cas3
LPLRGWAPGSKTPVPPVLVAAEEEEAADSDPSSFGARRQTLTEHTQEVIDAMKQLLEGLDDLGVNGHGEALLEAARKHDWGKAHPVFQQTLHGLQERPQESPAEILAKQDPGIGKRKHSQPHFRHELASALAMLQTGSGDLEAYLAAAHHGKVRMSIRSMPREKGKDGKRIARGVHEGDVLFQTDKLPGCELTLAPADLGRQTNEGERAWSDRVLALLEREGPFRLAYLETLLRAADERASQGKEAR